VTSTLSEVLIDCNDCEQVAQFWCAVLGWEVLDRDEEEGDVEIGTPGHPIRLLFLPVPEGKSIKNRIHLDVHAVDGDQAAEVERLIGLGATHADVGQGDDVDWVVLADPEGNEFCVLAGSPPR
jgi:catechol 2,3-dioxygenase-like lactoylglutathione lyase family enzyme